MRHWPAAAPLDDLTAARVTPRGILESSFPRIVFFVLFWMKGRVHSNFLRCKSRVSQQAGLSTDSTPGVPPSRRAPRTTQEELHQPHHASPELPVLSPPLQQDAIRHS